ncbi:ABC transporter ATP-binding protein [Reichenbachiella sp. MSK19-1]|uniref:ABC transporter ATP-binding protein n=1 Tax=Reichenbachiella sp. MSK19-1 TaxID=1897631 RepID=UPI000E6CDDDB|nr:ABC transporter ATP-binding protein [Reichenbachiella sp. MSK19-1]RJE70624.1 hypothetical protein BGP76_11095 [Reichenbachiella sp. MSK19-1]
MSALVQIQHVNKSFKDHQVLHDIHFEVTEGEIICILGESGSGKSTLLRIIGGLEDADQGNVTVDDETITGPANNLVPGYDFINFVTQHFKLEQFRTVRDNIYSVISYYAQSDADDRIHELLELCKLSEKAEAYPRELSGGQQQRVAIAMALADEPFLLLMDEPFSNLDVNMKTQIRGEIVEILRKAEVTVIFVSHDPVDAMAIADRVIILEDGHIAQIDTPQKIYQGPTSPYAAKFLGPINYLQVDGKPTGVRPEQIRIHKEGEHEGKVTKCIFMGMHYHVWLTSDIADKTILLYHSSALNIGQTVHFNLMTTEIT